MLRLIRFWLFAIPVACLAVVPYAYSFEVRRIYSLPKSSAIIVSATVLIFALLYALICSGAYRKLWSGVALLFAVDIASTAVSYFASENEYIALFGRFERVNGSLVFLSVLTVAFSLFVGIDRDRRRFKTALVAITIASIPVCIYGLLDTAPRAQGTFGNPNFYANYLLFPLFVTLGMLVATIVSRRVSNAAQASGLFAAKCALFGGALLLIAIELIASGTRGAWVGAAAGAFAFVIYSSFCIKRVAARSTLVISLFSLLGLVALAAAAFVLRHALQAGGGMAATAGGRFLVWRDAIAILPNVMKTGAGFDNFHGAFMPHRSLELVRLMPGVDWDTAHSTPLQILVTRGILGVGAYVSLIGLLIYSVSKAMRRAGVGDRLILGGVASSYIAYVVHNLANVDISATSLYNYAFLALGASASSCWASPGRAEATRAERRRVPKEPRSKLWARVAVGSALSVAAIGVFVAEARWLNSLFIADHESAVANAWAQLGITKEALAEHAPQNSLLHAGSAREAAPYESFYRAQLADALLWLSRVQSGRARDTSLEVGQREAEAATEHADNPTKAQTLVSNFYRLRNDIPRAIKALEAASADDPYQFEVRLEYARLLVRAGRPDDARLQVMLALELVPNDPDALALKSALEAGVVDLASAALERRP